MPQSMKNRAKYVYNPHTLRYERHIVPTRVILLRVLGFVATAIVTGLIVVAFAFRFLDSPKERVLRLQYEQAVQDFDLLTGKVSGMQQKLSELEKRDNEVYRTIFEANPVPDSARASQLEKDKEIRLVSSMDENQLAHSLQNTLNNVISRMRSQEKSYNEIEKMVKNKERLLTHTPAIQPINNRELKRIASGFGYRIDPIYKSVKFHAGLDFTAPQGTPIYATADGVVKTAGSSGNGFGKQVVVHHGFGYETLYGHMLRIRARVGQQVRRGQVIGWVGSSGKSTAPHLHYEVHKYGRPVDPIYFFYNDLSPGQYQQILKLASSSNQSFD